MQPDSVSLAPAEFIVPFETIRADFARFYPRMGISAPLAGTFAAEVERSA